LILVIDTFLAELEVFSVCFDVCDDTLGYRRSRVTLRWIKFPRILSMLWNVRDTTTGLLMTDFYRRWVSTLTPTTKSEALQQAQLDLLLGRNGPAGIDPTLSPRYAHPYYWAPFILTGNWK